MDANVQQHANALRSMASDEAADCLVRDYPLGSPDWGVALRLMEHLSFRREDWTRLARHYLARAPYADDQPYRLFLRALGVSRFLSVLAQVMTTNSDRGALLRYHLEPLLRDARGEDRAAADAFMAKVAL